LPRHSSNVHFESVHCVISDKRHVPRRFNGWREGKIKTHHHTSNIQGSPFVVDFLEVTLISTWTGLSYFLDEGRNTPKECFNTIRPTGKTRTVIQKCFHVVVIFVCFHCLPKHPNELRFILSNVCDELMLINKVRVMSLDVLTFALDSMKPLSVRIYAFEDLICEVVNL